jgi:hypothetical protein
MFETEAPSISLGSSLSVNTNHDLDQNPHGEPEVPDIAGMFVGNAGEPVRLAKVSSLDGFAANTVGPGDQVSIWVHQALTSDDPAFHRIAANLRDLIGNWAQENGKAVNIERANIVLLVMKGDQSAELWMDTAAMMFQAVMKRAIGPGHVIFENDIADVTGVIFPAVTFNPDDRVVCVMREGWRFGMSFDFNPGKNLDVVAFSRTLATLHRAMRYREAYDATRNAPQFDRLVDAGWFPFVEILGREFTNISDFAEQGTALAHAEQELIAAFDQSRLDRIYERWMAKPHFAKRTTVLKSGLDAFVRKDPVACIKTLLTEIEGILNDAYRSVHGGQGARTKDLLRFAIENVTSRLGGSDTLMFPEAFARYLDRYTFADFDPAANRGSASSRHAVGHGAAAPETYTDVRALHAILALDQLMFYT